MKERIKAALAERSTQGLYRHRQSFSARMEATIERDKQGYINFSSNDYLGLAHDSELIKAWQYGVHLYGCGSGASPMVTGHHKAHLDLESCLTQWLGYERAILFPSGFSANQALILTLLNRKDVLVQDKLNHASLIEAGWLSETKMKRFKHNDLEHLRSVLSKEALAIEGSMLVATEGVFSMDGDCAPLEGIENICRSYNAFCMVDDAHGIGV